MNGMHATDAAWVHRDEGLLGLENMLHKAVALDDSYTGACFWKE
jgi:hypothetical protein